MIPVKIKTLILTGISVVSIKSFQTLKWMKTFNANYKVVIRKLVSRLNFKTQSQIAGATIVVPLVTNNPLFNIIYYLECNKWLPIRK